MKTWWVIAATGEQVSVGLVSLAIQKEGGRAQSFLGSQVRILTDSAFTRARIKSIDAEKVHAALRDGKIAVVAGFQGMDDDGNVTTLITCALLYWFGQQFGASVIQGFAVTLAIGVAISLFSAVFITRTFLRAIVGWRIVQNPVLFGSEITPTIATPPETRTRPLRLGELGASS